jgi:hypothetical protein
MTQLDSTSSGFSLRLASGRLFWNTASEIVSVAIDGTDRRVHFTSTRDLVGPAVDATRIYVWESDAVPVSPGVEQGPPTYHLVTVSY